MPYIDYVKDIWELVRSSFLSEMTEETVNLWFGELAIKSFENNCVTFTTESELKHNVILKNGYDKRIAKEFTKILGFNVDAKVIFTGEPASAEKLIQRINSWAGLNGAKIIADESENEEEPMTEVKKDDDEPMVEGALPPYNFEYTFDNFIVGNSNKFAHAACLAVAENQAEDYNPLFIYGPSGLGKTHLLYAITNRIKENRPGVKIIYIKAEDFTNQMVESMSRSAMNEFHDKYRKCDVLLIDDIQFIAGKVATQEEFFHTFNTLYEDHRQIILASDRPPREINPLNDRLKNRFEWGLLADIQPPDVELRSAILKKKAEQVNIVIPNDVLQFLAENLRSNIRQIEGAIKKLAALYFLSGKNISLETAQGCIAELLGGEEPTSVTVDKVFTVVERKYGISREDMVSQKRNKEIALARHVANYLIREITEMSYPNIAKVFNRHYSTVISSIEFVEKKMKTDISFDIQVKTLKKYVTTMDHFATLEGVERACRIPMKLDENFFDQKKE
jgi:chromosomal replication initiator protein